MAYAAVASLFDTLQHLLDSSRTSVAPSAEKSLKSAILAAKRLRDTLEENDKIKNSSKGVMTVEARIRDHARRLEDLIESDVSAQFLSQSQSNDNGVLSLNLDHMRHVIKLFVKTSNNIKAEYIKELCRWAEEADVAVSSSLMESGGKDMVGLTDLFLQLRDIITEDNTTKRKRFSIHGMAGIGKTKLVRKLLQDSLIKEKFQHRAFVSVGRKYDYHGILRDILAQLNHASDNMIMERHESVVRYFERYLRDMKFLIVLDDVWDLNYENDFGRAVPVNFNGSCIIVISRNEINTLVHTNDRFKVRFLNEDESWELLQREVFGEEEGNYCPPELVKAGKKIAQNCEGLPLLILTVAQILLKAPISREYWEEVAQMKNSVFEDACDQLYKLLLPSYHYLKQKSKACFLYMVTVFPKNCVFRHSRIMDLWHSERFADNLAPIFYHIGLCNLFVIREQSVYSSTKSCNVHLVYRHLARRVAQDIKFLRVLDTYDAEEAGSSAEERGIQGIRHLAIYFNSLLAMKEVHNSIAYVSNLRSVLCTGSYHQYQVPICLELKLLRVLDALTIRFYEFPVEVVKLIRLKYLSLTTNANLPPSISKLWFLEYLTVHQHWSIINQSRVADESYVPMEIWELQELQHLQIVGRNLPPPPPGATLPNLIQLLDVGAQTCTKEVLERIPKLKKLRFQIEFALESHTDDGQNIRSSCFDHISSGLVDLDSLGSVIVNPIFMAKPRIPPRLFSVSKTHIKKLSLSGFGYPWEDINVITQIPCLHKLKLQSYAFRGEKWETKASFSIFHLLIEDSDLVQWTSADEKSPHLRKLTLKNCYRLREIPLSTVYGNIELVDCNPLAEIYVKQTQKCNVEVSCTWNS